MTDPTPYLESLVFFVDFVPVGELFPHTATVYHESKESIKKYIKEIEIRNRWNCIGVKYHNMRNGIMQTMKEWK